MLCVYFCLFTLFWYFANITTENNRFILFYNVVQTVKWLAAMFELSQTNKKTGILTDFFKKILDF